MYKYIVYWTFLNPLDLQQICATPATTYEEAQAIAFMYRQRNIPVSICPIRSRP